MAQPALKTVPKANRELTDFDPEEFQLILQYLNAKDILSLSSANHRTQELVKDVYKDSNTNVDMVVVRDLIEIQLKFENQAQNYTWQVVKPNIYDQRTKSARCWRGELIVVHRSDKLHAISSLREEQYKVAIPLIRKLLSLFSASVDTLITDNCKPHCIISHLLSHNHLSIVGPPNSTVNLAKAYMSYYVPTPERPEDPRVFFVDVAKRWIQNWRIDRNLYWQLSQVRTVTQKDLGLKITVSRFDTRLLGYVVRNLMCGTTEARFFFLDIDNFCYQPEQFFLEFNYVAKGGSDFRSLSREEQLQKLSEEGLQLISPSGRRGFMFLAPSDGPFYPSFHVFLFIGKATDYPYQSTSKWDLLEQIFPGAIPTLPELMDHLRTRQAEAFQQALNLQDELNIMRSLSATNTRYLRRSPGHLGAAEENRLSRILEHMDVEILKLDVSVRKLRRRTVTFGYLIRIALRYARIDGFFLITPPPKAVRSVVPANPNGGTTRKLLQNQNQ